ncbi:MAG: hypothetical protein ACREOJ_06905 [Gemmatimonadaceae bacterium]
MRHAYRLSYAYVHTAVFAAGLLAATGALHAQQLAAAPDSTRSTAVTPPALSMTQRIAAAAVPRVGERVYAEARQPGQDQVTVILVREGLPLSTDETVWPVQLRWVVMARRASDSFVADVYGRASDSGRLYLDGVITEGTRSGSAIHIETDRNVGRDASVTITPMKSR